MSEYTEGHYHIWHPRYGNAIVKYSYNEHYGERLWLFNNLRYSTHGLLEAGCTIGPKIEPWVPFEQFRLSIDAVDLALALETNEATEALLQEAELVLKALREGKTSPVDLGPLKWKASK